MKPGGNECRNGEHSTIISHLSFALARITRLEQRLRDAETTIIRLNEEQRQVEVRTIRRHDSDAKQDDLKMTCI